MSEELKRLYETADEAVRPSGFSEATAAAFYCDYVEFVTNHAAPGTLLDLGCGSGWSAHLLSKAGFDTVGLDVTAAAFEPAESPSLQFQEGDAARLPFADATFDVVAAYQFLEHTPEPQRVLTEASRVLKPRGWLFIVGPNLVGLAPSLAAATVHVWRNRPLRRILVRDGSMPMQPFGNTLPEIGRFVVSNIFLLISKVLSPEVRFTMRQPDLDPPFHADNDACFLCNPLDVTRALRALGFDIVRSGKLRRSRLLTMVAGGTWIAARNQTGAA